MYFDLPVAILFFIFFVVLTLLYFVSRRTIQSLFLVLASITNESVAAGIIAIIFYPGTVIHELSHFVAAVMLLQPVHNISLIPSREGKTLRLGYVLYEKKDVIRGILVGIAPIVTGILLLWWLYTIHFFEFTKLTIHILKAYIMFVLSSTMFSSKQDLIDIWYVIPFFIIIGSLVYFFNLNIFFIFENRSLLEAIRNFMYAVTIYTCISMGIHILILMVCHSIRRLLHIY